MIRDIIGSAGILGAKRRSKNVKAFLRSVAEYPFRLVRQGQFLQTLPRHKNTNNNRARSERKSVRVAYCCIQKWMAIRQDAIFAEQTTKGKTTPTIFTRMRAHYTDSLFRKCKTLLGQNRTAKRDWGRACENSKAIARKKPRGKTRKKERCIVCAKARCSRRRQPGGRRRPRHRCHGNRRWRRTSGKKERKKTLVATKASVRKRQVFIFTFFFFSPQAAAEAHALSLLSLLPTKPRSVAF